MKALQNRLPIAGREREIEVLEKYLDDALRGLGSCVFISGEAGVGKTRLLEEIKEIAEAKGFAVMSSQCLLEDVTIYGPFRAALKSGGLEHLFAEVAPRVDGAYLVTDNGLLAKSVTREKNGLDPDLFASMLSTVSRFLKDSLEMPADAPKPESIRRLDYGDRSVLVERGEGVHLVTVLTGKENEFLMQDMRTTIEKIDSFYGSVLRSWDGDEERLRGVDVLFCPFLAKYDGVIQGERDPKVRRNILFENVTRGLVRRARKCPILLCIEDLQWADPSTLALLHYLIRNSQKCGLVIMGSYRPEDLLADGARGHPIVDAMSKMEREGLLSKMELARLPKCATSQLINSLLGARLNEDITALIHRESDGNPLFAIELTRFYADENALICDEGNWRLVQSLLPHNLPTHVRDVMTRRLDRLEDDRRMIADMAAVIGEEVDIKLLVKAAGIDETWLARILKVMEEKYRIFRQRDGRYRFDHVKLKEVLYGDMPDPAKRDYHGAVAASIESLHGEDTVAVAGEIAYHLLRSREPGQASPHLIRAAEHARRQYANEEAIRFYREALGIEEDVEQKVRILEALGDLAKLAGRHAESLGTYEEAMQIAAVPKDRARIGIKIGIVHTIMGNLDKAFGVCNDAMALVKDEGDWEEAFALNQIGNIHYRRGEYDKALEFYEKSHKIREGIADEGGIADSLSNAGNVHVNRGEYERALECYKKSLEIRERIGDEIGIAICLTNIGSVYSERGDHEKDLDCYRKSLEIRERIGDQTGLAVGLANIGAVHANRGECDEALRLLEKSLELQERIGDTGGVATNLVNIGVVRGYQGEYDDALEHLEKALRISEKSGNQKGIANALMSIGEVQYQQGECGKALESLSRSLEIYDRIGMTSMAALSRCGIAKTQLKGGNRKEAVESCNRAIEISTGIGNKEFIATAFAVRGMINKDEGKWKESAEDFQESIRIFTEIGMRKLLADSYYELGLMWSRKGDKTDAEDCLQKASDIYSTLNLKRGVEKAETAILETPGHGP